MHLPDGGVGERPTDVRPATVIALMCPSKPVLDQATASAVHPARAQLGVERVQHFAVETGDRQVTDERPEAQANGALVGPHGRWLDGQQFEVAVHELVDRGLGTRIPLLVHLAEQAGPYPLCFLPRARSGRHSFHDVVQLLR
jgi:hypothetical protein